MKLTEPVESQEVQLDAPIKGFHINGEYLLFWDDAHVGLPTLVFTTTIRLTDFPLQNQQCKGFPTRYRAGRFHRSVRGRRHLLQPTCIHDGKGLLGSAHAKGTPPKKRVNLPTCNSTFQGTEKNSVNFPKAEGEPELLDLKGKWLCLATTRGYIKIYNLDDK